MIEQISGQLLEKSPTFCVLDCHGLGIGLYISLNTFQQLEVFPRGHRVELYTYLHVREDALQLYGFSKLAEKKMFQLLISISGVGPKLAVAILSGGSADELGKAIAEGDLYMLTGIPGVGKKTAQRIILELKEKIQKQIKMDPEFDVAGASTQERKKVDEVILALVSLGYKELEAKRRVDKILQNSEGNLSLEKMIKEALRDV